MVARLHRSESGAVALLCLAALLILFMAVLVMFDASKATQAKTDVQIGADTAAYSAGATGARAMNMVAFANVGKRTAVGIHNMYVYEYNAYKSWVDQMCGCCCNCTFCACPDLKCCFNCSGNKVSLLPLFEMIDMILYALGNDLFKNLEELHAFQEELAEIGKVWGVSEAQVRGVRNNANMMVVWPDPIQSDDSYTKLPIELSDYKSESCLTPLVPFNQRNPTTNWTTAEFLVNWRVLTDRSISSPLWASDGPSEVAGGTAYKHYTPATARAAQACAGLDNILFAFGHGIWALIAQLMVPDEAAPMFVDVADSSNPWLSGDDQLRMSYMLYSYKHVPDLGRKLRENYNFMGAPRYQYQRAETAQYPETGLWGMARGEFYFPPPNQPDMNNSGEHEMWLFHPGWMGKLRPIMLPYESTDIANQSWEIEMDEMVQESLPTGVGLANTVFSISGVPGYDSSGFTADQQYLLQNVSRDMIGGGTFGNEWKHYLDGSAK